MSTTPGAGADPGGTNPPLWLPVPALLHSVYEEGPFRACTVCRQSLDDGRFYQVAKKFEGKETILEMAICMTCAAGTSSEFSERSMSRLQRFYTQELKPTESPHACHACRTPRDVARGYEVAGICTRGHIVAPVLAICASCSERVMADLSKKTRDRYGEFFHDNFPGLPKELDLVPLI
ncbi:MAG: hypothetical protein HY608_01740 [Planctomycetes bacterium]|nr:hypothetical protein [Planctomycetota bacterium]